MDVYSHTDITFNIGFIIFSYLFRKSPHLSTVLAEGLHSQRKHILLLKPKSRNVCYLPSKYYFKKLLK